MFICLGLKSSFKSDSRNVKDAGYSIMKLASTSPVCTGSCAHRNYGIPARELTPSPPPPKHQGNLTLPTSLRQFGSPSPSLVAVGNLFRNGIYMYLESPFPMTLGTWHYNSAHPVMCLQKTIKLSTTYYSGAYTHFFCLPDIHVHVCTFIA